MLKTVLSAGFGALFATTLTASAQTFPTKPLTMIIPFAAGGPTDVLGRVVGQRMGQILGQSIIIENVGGAGGMTGSKRVVDAAPDGYNFVLGTVGTHAQGQTLYKKPLYNAATDFTPVALLAEVPIIVVARKDLPVKDFKEFVAYAKANQAKMQYGSAGAGSATHLGCVLLNYIIGTDITHVPYRGTGPAMQDLQGICRPPPSRALTSSKPIPGMPSSYRRIRPRRSSSGSMTPRCRRSRRPPFASDYRNWARRSSPTSVQRRNISASL